MRLPILCLALVTGPLAAETIVCFGDSLTAGYGLAEDQAWPAVVGEALRTEAPAWRVVNAGRSGDTSAAALRRLDWSLKARPELVILAIGANDGLRGLPLAELRDNLGVMLQRIQAAGARPILAGMRLPTNLGEDYRTGFAAIYPALAQGRGVTLIPFLLEGVAMVPELNQADRIHPTAEGHRLIAATVLQTVRPLVVAGGSSTTANAP